MPSPKGDPTYIKNKEKYFIEVAKTLALHLLTLFVPGGCVVVRDREILGDGRALLTDSKVEIDPVCYAIAAACKRGTPMTGAVIYSTRYPFSASVFQAYIMGIGKIVVLAHEWEPYYKDEFREQHDWHVNYPLLLNHFFENEDPRFSVNAHANQED